MFIYFIKFWKKKNNHNKNKMKIRTMKSDEAQWDRNAAKVDTGVAQVQLLQTWPHCRDHILDNTMHVAGRKGHDVQRHRAHMRGNILERQLAEQEQAVADDERYGQPLKVHARVALVGRLNVHDRDVKAVRRASDEKCVHEVAPLTAHQAQ